MCLWLLWMCFGNKNGGKILLKTFQVDRTLLNIEWYCFSGQTCSTVRRACSVQCRRNHGTIVGWKKWLIIRGLRYHFFGYLYNTDTNQVQNFDAKTDTICNKNSVLLLKGLIPKLIPKSCKVRCKNLLFFDQSNENAQFFASKGAFRLWK